jgi:outer membrane lipoprotein LolB
MKRMTRWFVLAATLAVSACATVAPGSRELPAAGASPFDLSGRVLVNYDRRAFSSSIRWQHAQQRDEIWLLSPVGQTLAYIDAAAAGATLTAADRTQYRAGSVDSLTRRALGWELPLAQLQYWVQGEAAPFSTPEAVARDAEARITALTQDGWRIVLIYFPQAEHGGLPRRLELTQGANQIRLVIDSWRRDALAP